MSPGFDVFDAEPDFTTKADLSDMIFAEARICVVERNSRFLRHRAELLASSIILNALRLSIECEAGSRCGRLKGVMAMAIQVLSKVLNPEALRIPASEGSGAGVPSWSMAPRLDSLDGKTVYMVNQGFGGSDLFMEQFQAWFAENMPTVKTVLKRKTGFIFQR